MAEVRRRKGEGDSADILSDDKQPILQPEPLQLSDSATADSSDHVSINF